MTKRRDFNTDLIEALKDSKEAQNYLNTALEKYRKDNDTAAFLQALRAVTEANGGITVLSEKTRLNRQNLYRILSDEGNPRLNTLLNILGGLGLGLSVSQP